MPSNWSSQTVKACNTRPKPLRACFERYWQTLIVKLLWHVLFQERVIRLRRPSQLLGFAMRSAIAEVLNTRVSPE